MKKFNFLVVLSFIFSTFSVVAQEKYEREFRIRKKEFPPKALQLIETRLSDAKRIKYYKEIDSSITSFEVKFKKARLWYSIEFDTQGELEDIEIKIKSVDIPNDSYEAIERYLHNTYSMYKIQKIQQQYKATTLTSTETTLKNAFQNLMLPTVNYELMVAGKKEAKYEDFQILFDAGGNFKSIKKSLPPNYDHILY
ncbi:hypothetical protein KO500_03990 [Cellulophaga baltica]|uniref:hypothetical protein n=1 Tax=Cellulophaga TaxID=104264 RepID=UPI001C0655EE|nr:MULTISPECIES: hypothetical protein [Cellulophaga]MBU2995575.1 hypothetical protein [Cellulophaga baltica]MDO6766969.1 hypothetical protein [Cellulophaga sp. 1_MG-2023]